MLRIYATTRHIYIVAGSAGGRQLYICACMLAYIYICLHTYICCLPVAGSYIYGRQLYICMQAWGIHVISQHTCLVVAYRSMYMYAGMGHTCEHICLIVAYRSIYAWLYSVCLHTCCYITCMLYNICLHVCCCIYSSIHIPSPCGGKGHTCDTAAYMQADATYQACCYMEPAVAWGIHVLHI